MTQIRPEDEVVNICQELIRIDTSNYGDGSGPGERAAAEYAAGLITEVGLDVEDTVNRYLAQFDRICEAAGVALYRKRASPDLRDEARSGNETRPGK